MAQGGILRYKIKRPQYFTTTITNLLTLPFVKILLTRESVAIGDGIDAPHAFEFIVTDNTNVAAIIETVFRSHYLASIAGGKATWSAVSNVPLAVLAQQWNAPRMLLPTPLLSTLAFTDNTLSLFFRYHTQQDPDLVHDQLSNAHARRNQ